MFDKKELNTYKLVEVLKVDVLGYQCRGFQAGFQTL
jgi:hypothetical protein